MYEAKRIWDSYPQILIEIGCGSGDIALEIAKANPSIGVIATDIFDISSSEIFNPYDLLYTKIYEKWDLPAQQSDLPNLIVTRAGDSIIEKLPDNSVDYILAVNLDHSISCSFLARYNLIGRKLKRGGSFILKPYYSRIWHSFLKPWGLFYNYIEDCYILDGLELKISERPEDMRMLWPDLKKDSGWNTDESAKFVMIFTKQEDIFSRLLMLHKGQELASIDTEAHIIDGIVKVLEINSDGRTLLGKVSSSDESTIGQYIHEYCFNFGNTIDSLLDLVKKTRQKMDQYKDKVQFNKEEIDKIEAVFKRIEAIASYRHKSITSDGCYRDL